MYGRIDEWNGPLFKNWNFVSSNPLGSPSTLGLLMKVFLTFKLKYQENNTKINTGWLNTFSNKKKRKCFKKNVESFSYSLIPQILKFTKSSSRLVVLIKFLISFCFKVEMKKGERKKRNKVFQRALESEANGNTVRENFEHSMLLSLLKKTFGKHQLIKTSMKYVYMKPEVKEMIQQQWIKLQTKLVLGD